MSKLSVDIQSTQDWQWDKPAEHFCLSFNGSIRILKLFLEIPVQPGGLSSTLIEHLLTNCLIHESEVFQSAGSRTLIIKSAQVTVKVAL